MKMILRQHVCQWCEPSRIKYFMAKREGNAASFVGTCMWQELEAAFVGNFRVVDRSQDLHLSDFDYFKIS